MGVLFNRHVEGNKITYKANKLHPFFSILQQFDFRKYVGLDAIIENIVGKTGDIEKVYLFGWLCMRSGYEPLVGIVFKAVPSAIILLEQLSADDH